MNTVERIYQQASVLPPQDIQKLVDMLLPIIKPNPVMTEDEFWMKMWNEGKLAIKPIPLRERKTFKFDPIKTTGKPASEMIIEDRR